MGLIGTKDTSAALGHASETFTMRIYQHVVADVNAERVVEAIALAAKPRAPLARLTVGPLAQW